MQQLFEQIVFTLGDFNITTGNIAIALLGSALILVLHRLTIRRWLPAFFESNEVEPVYHRRLRTIATWCAIFLFALTLVAGLGLNPVLYAKEETRFFLSGLVGVLLAWQLARFFDLTLSLILAQQYRRRRREARDVLTRVHLPADTSQFHNRTVQYVVYLIALFILVSIFGINQSVDIPLGNKPISLSLSNLIIAAIILLVARAIIWILIQLVLTPYYQRKEINIGSQFAINQLIKYVLYVVAVLIALQALGVQMTIIWGGAAALLVGVGLGLQQTFNDFFSGLILLFERSVEVGDVVNVGGLIGTVRRIGLRASHIQTRDNITVIVPNSKLVIDNVINWSHNDNRARFFVSVGVAYGTDTDLVRRLLIEAAQRHEKILNFPKPFVRFVSFGNSSLDFEVHFWSTELVRIEDVKSDLRFAIDQAFREHNVTIPFPQQDVWFRNAIPPVPDAGKGPGG